MSHHHTYVDMHTHIYIEMHTHIYMEIQVRAGHFEDAYDFRMCPFIQNVFSYTECVLLYMVNVFSL